MGGVNTGGVGDELGDDYPSLNHHSLADKSQNMYDFLHEEERPPRMMIQSAVVNHFLSNAYGFWTRILQS